MTLQYGGYVMTNHTTAQSMRDFEIEGSQLRTIPKPRAATARLQVVAPSPDPDKLAGAGVVFNYKSSHECMFVLIEPNSGSELSRQRRRPSRRGEAYPNPAILDQGQNDVEVIEKDDHTTEIKVNGKTIYTVEGSTEGGLGIIGLGIGTYRPSSFDIWRVPGMSLLLAVCEIGERVKLAGPSPGLVSFVQVLSALALIRRTEEHLAVLGCNRPTFRNRQVRAEDSGCPRAGDDPNRSAAVLGFEPGICSRRCAGKSLLRWQQVPSSVDRAAPPSTLDWQIEVEVVRPRKHSHGDRLCDCYKPSV